MNLTILGNNSALPAYGRFPTAQVLEMHGQVFLIDCGEGAQMRMQQFAVRSARINHILISHMHGDHFLGLAGFISSLSLLGREKKLNIYCPKEIRKIIQLQLPWKLGFEIHYHFLKEGERAILIDAEKYAVSCFPVYHSVPTHGFLFTEKKRKRVLVPKYLQEYEIPKYFYARLAEGEDYTDKYGEVVKNDWVTAEGHPPKVYAYTADTRFAPEIIPDIQGADLLYHESTYLHERIDKAIDRLHTTALQAGTIARDAGVKKLIIGHFSSKYKDLQPFEDEARSVFENTELALEGKTFEI
ncbi:MAG: ribonuclease Z [Chitinophagaceae bacterium]|nr:ribonuclease Z [Chitinophagaceae bacterium]